MSIPFRFVCITDDPEGLVDGIEVIPLPKFAMEPDSWNKGMWPKLSAFQPGMFESGTPVIMMDVDVVITQDLAPMIDHLIKFGGLHIIKDWQDTLERWFPAIWKKERKSNSSTVGFIAGEQDHIWAAFHTKSATELFAQARNDQDFIHKMARNRQHWPAGWVLSFKKSLAWHFPVSLFLSPSKPPETCFVVCFHGRPDPMDLSRDGFSRWGSNEKFGFFQGHGLSAIGENMAAE